MTNDTLNPDQVSEHAKNRQREEVGTLGSGNHSLIGAVHSRFHLSRQRQTDRILRAMDRPYFTILAHPRGRLIQEREPYDVDMPRIIRQARQRRASWNSTSIHRLDLLDSYCQLAKEEGGPMSINSGAHGVLDLQNLRFGVGQARHGWFEKEDALNTRTLPELRQLLKRPR